MVDGPDFQIGDLVECITMPAFLDSPKFGEHYIITSIIGLYNRI